MLKEVCKVSWYYWHFDQIILWYGAILCIGRCLAAPLASTHWKPTMGGSRHTQNIQISKVMGEDEKGVFYFMEKTKQTFWPTPYIYTHNTHSKAKLKRYVVLEASLRTKRDIVGGSEAGLHWANPQLSYCRSLSSGQFPHLSALLPFHL